MEINIASYMYSVQVMTIVNKITTPTFHVIMFTVNHSCLHDKDPNVGSLFICSCHDDVRVFLPISDVPRDPPILVTSPKTALAEGQKFNFRCDLKYPGNPPMIWTWRCGERTLVPSQFNNMGASSEITFEAESWQNGLSCLCIASSPRFGYNISSKGQSIAVLCKLVHGYDFLKIIYSCLEKYWKTRDNTLQLRIYIYLRKH